MNLTALPLKMFQVYGADTIHLKVSVQKLFRQNFVFLLTVCCWDPYRTVYDNILKTGVFTARNLCSNPAGVFLFRHEFLHSNHTSYRQPFIFFQILQGTLFSFVGDLLGIYCRINDFFKYRDRKRVAGLANDFSRGERKSVVRVTACACSVLKAQLIDRCVLRRNVRLNIHDI